MKKLTKEFLYRVFPNCNKKLVANLLPYLLEYLPYFGIDNNLKLCHFFAQAGHETDSFKTLTEYATGENYEGRSDLGNTEHGDGRRFKGRGIFQTTGRRNYTETGRKIAENPIFGHLRYDFADDEVLKNPELLASPMWAVASALIYWQERNLSALCVPDSEIVTIKRYRDGRFVNYDCSPLEAITRKINGGINGLADRKKFYERLQKELENEQ